MSEEELDLKPKPPSKLAPRGIETFTVCRQHDETGVSGEGVIIEGVVLGTGQCIVHWLYPPHAEVSLSLTRWQTLLESTLNLIQRIKQSLLTKMIVKKHLVMTN